MKLTLRYDLPFITATLTYHGRSLAIPHVLIDTGSASSVFATDAVRELGIIPSPDDRLRFLRGVGGTESVFTRAIDRLEVSGAKIPDFQIEVGGMDYGFEINGILGMNFLLRTGAVIDLRTSELSFPEDATSV